MMEMDEGRKPSVRSGRCITVIQVWVCIFSTIIFISLRSKTQNFHQPYTILARKFDA